MAGDIALWLRLDIGLIVTIQSGDILAGCEEPVGQEFFEKVGFR